MENSSLSTQFVVSVLLSECLVELVDTLVILYLVKIELRIGDIGIGASIRIQYTMYHLKIDREP
jgi:hypothetical protein